MTAADKTQDFQLARSLIEGSPLATLVKDLWQRVRIDWSFATDHLAAAFRTQRQLGSHERRFAAETLYGMIRNLRRIDEALARGGYRKGSGAPDDLRLAAYLVLEAGAPADDAARRYPDVDWNAVRTIDDALRSERDVTRRIALRWSLPDWLAALLVDDLGAADAEALAEALNQRAPMTVRANRLVGDREALAAALASEGIETEPGRFAADALHVIGRTNLFGLNAFRKGAFEAQDEGSQLIAELVAPPPRGLVVDYCAGAGGKTLAIAAALGGRGRVVACDVHKNKLTELKRRAKRAGVTNAQSVRLDEEGWAPPLERLRGGADRVLVDAPCTGIGALRRNPEARWRLTPADLQRLPVQQLEICERALDLVAPGGRLIYATCTVTSVENRNVVDKLTTVHPELETVTAREIWGAERAEPVTDPSGTFLELFPHRHGTDGFFAAVLRRRK